MVASPRSATVMGLLEEARLARARGQKAAAQAGSVKTVLGRAKDWFLEEFLRKRAPLHEHTQYKPRSPGLSV